MTNRDKRFFELARKLSRKSNHHTYKLGCVISKRKFVVGVGWNQMKTHSKSPHAFKNIHAELHAILGAMPSDLEGATVYVYREHKNGLPALAKPCKCCEKMLCNCNIKKVCYTIDNGYEWFYF